MSTAPPSSVPKSVPPPGVHARPKEVKLVSHSNLFYWWPVWLLAFFMATWTSIEGNRLAVVPSKGMVEKTADGSYTLRFPGPPTQSLEDAVRNTRTDEPTFRPRVSQHSWLGAVFLVGLLLTIVVTNVPLRGLWSFITILSVIFLAVIIAWAGKWDAILEALGHLHIHINMAGYLFLGVCVFAIWAVATFVFDRRSYIIFTPGQIKYCEHIGAGVETFPAAGVALEKQRDDLFRHYILGFGSGDLILKANTGGHQREIRLPNVLGIGWRLKTVEDMLRQVSTSSD